jgi:hypothetical protein
MHVLYGYVERNEISTELTRLLGCFSHTQLKIEEVKILDILDSQTLHVEVQPFDLHLE